MLSSSIRVDDSSRDHAIGSVATAAGSTASRAVAPALAPLLAAHRAQARGEPDPEHPRENEQGVHVSLSPRRTV
jgi:hypothetical protein